MIKCRETLVSSSSEVGGVQRIWKMRGGDKKVRLILFPLVSPSTLHCHIVAGTGTVISGINERNVTINKDRNSYKE